MQYDLEKAFPKTTDGFHKRVAETLEHLPEKKERIVYMERQKNEHWTVRKAAVVTCVAVMAMGTTVFAAGKASQYISTEDVRPVYTSLPTAEQIQEDYGFSPKMVDAFSNEYSLQDVTKGEDEVKDDAGNSLGTAQHITLNYAKGDETASLTVSEQVLGDMSEELCDSSEAYAGVTLYYYNDNYKFVPSDYKMTEQDKADEAAGTYIFSYGSDEVEIDNYQSVMWEDEGCQYVLSVLDSELTEQELLSMAKEIIDVEN